jgi:DNA polymerase-3 subunit epsilon
MTTRALAELVEQLGQPLACLDIETTGGHTERDRMTEIAVITLHPDGSQERWFSLINPECWIPAHITRLTGIDETMVVDAPSFSDLAAELFERLEGSILVAHNARFDLGFIKQAFRRVNIRFNPRVVCSVKLSRQLFANHKGHGLDAVMERHGLVCEARHRALGDAQVVADFLGMLASAQLDALVDACRAQWSLPSLPPNMPADMLDDIPDGPGVYLIYGENELPLYIGKSIHLRQRVLDHFRNDHRQQKEMRIAQQAQRVEWIETPGELSALLLESRLIKEKSPALNRKLRRTRELCTIRWVLGSDKPPQIVCGDDINPGDSFGTFRNVSEANKTLRDLAAKHALCDIRLGLQRGAGACFAHQLKRCRGVCVGKETPMQHDLRLAQALQALRITRSLAVWWTGRLTRVRPATRGSACHRPVALSRHGPHRRRCPRIGKLHAPEL